MEPSIVKEVVDKLIGDISPIGESNHDAESIGNLKEYCDVISQMVAKIEDISYYNKNSQEYSVKEHVNYINKFIKNGFKL